MANDIEWNIDMEVNLFHAMRGHKPAGVNKHFQMIAIHDKLCSSLKKISSEEIWKHLATLYDLQALNESEIVPFPNKAGEFVLHDRDIGDLCQKSFPRSTYISSAPTDTAKLEANSKNAPKTVKSESSKSSFQTPKSESKSEAKPTSVSKSDSRTTTPSSRSDQKSSSSNSSNKALHSGSTTNTPVPSPNRRQRKRTANPSDASPAKQSESSAKRRR